MGREGSAPGRNAFRIREAISRLIVDAALTDRPVCLDSPALISYLEDYEVLADLVAPILEHPRVPVVISTISLCEALVGRAKLGDELAMRRMARGLHRLPRLVIVPFHEAMAHRAAIVRARTGLKLPDAGIVATGLSTSAIAIVGNDARWRGKPLGLPYIHLTDFATSD